VSQADQALRQLVDVVLDAAAVGVEEVARHQDAVLAMCSWRLRVWLWRSAVICHDGGGRLPVIAASSLHRV
jgi:hypothetical protein